MPTDKQQREYEEAKEEGRIGTPDSDTSVQLSQSFSLKDVWFLVPMILSVLGTALMLYLGGFPMWVLMTAFVVCAVTVMFGLTLVASSHEYNDPTEIIAGWVSYFSNWFLMPITDPFAAKLRIHGIKRPFADGTIEMDDGTLIGIRKMSGRTTQNITQETFNEIGAQFGNNIDEGVKNFPFKFVSQTRPEDVEEMVGEWEDVAYSGVLDQVRGYLGEFFRAKVEWMRDVDAPAANAHEMNNYVVVRVGPEDIPSHLVDDDGEEDAEDTSGPSRWTWPFRFVAGMVPYKKFSPFDHAAAMGNEEYPSLSVRKEIQSELQSRLRVLDRHLLSGIDGCEVEKVSVEEHVALLLAYWTGEHHDPDEEFEQWFNRDRAEDVPSVWPPSRLFSAGDREHGVEDPENVPGSEEARQALQTAVPDAKDDDRLSGDDLSMSPSHFRQRSGYMEIGDQYVAGFWIADHRTWVEAGFAKGLYQLEGIDYTITWDVTPVNEEAAIEEARQAELNSSAKSGRQAEIQSRQLVNDTKIFEDAQDLLSNTPAQAWDISGYVVLRAGPRAANAYAAREENEHKDFDGLDEAKMEALLDAEDELKKAVRGSPFNGELVKPQRWQKEVLESASPNKGNVYNERLKKDAPGRTEKYLDMLLGDEETSGPKQRRVFGGWLGALFPPCQATINEEGGFHWGRDSETGLPFRTNPADRHTGGHMVTTGITRSGKTYSGSKATAGWITEGFLSQVVGYMREKPNRVFVAADTQGGFEGLCNLVGGEHIDVSGDTRMNPFDARPPSNPHQNSDPYRMAVNFVTEFIKRILRSQEVDPSEYHTVIERGVEANYEQAGMATGEFIPDDEMPDMESAIEIWKDMQKNPANYSHSASGGHESDRKSREAGELLDYMSGFREGGKYENLMGQTTFSMSRSDGKEGWPEFYYLDLSGLASSNDAEKSAMLWLAQHFVTQKSRESNDELIFLGDEAHLMLYSDEQVELILRWLREWARNNSWVWLITQNLSELMIENDGSKGGKKQAMWDQFAFKQIFNYPTTDEDALRKVLPKGNERMVEEAQNSLTTALAEQGVTECFVEVEDNDKPGWHRVQVEACPLMDHALNYDPKADYSFDEYMQYFLHTDALAPVERLFATEEEKEKEPEITNRRGLADLYAQQNREDEATVTEMTDTTESPEAGPARDDEGRFVSTEADD